MKYTHEPGTNHLHKLELTEVEAMLVADILLEADYTVLASEAGKNARDYDLVSEQIYDLVCDIQEALKTPLVTSYTGGKLLRSLRK